MVSPVAWDMEFADSEVRAVQRHGVDVHLLFSAVSATQHTPAGGLLTGYLQGVTIVLLQCVEPLSLATLMGRVRYGRLRLQDGQDLRRIPVPAVWKQPVTLELEPAQGELLQLQARGIECMVQQGGVFRESLFC